MHGRRRDPTVRAISPAPIGGVGGGGALPSSTAPCRRPVIGRKTGRSWAESTQPVLAERPGIGGAYLVPSPTSPDQPIRHELASGWPHEGQEACRGAKAERFPAARLPAQVGHGAEALPDVDVAAAGGWTETNSLKQCYQQADEATMLRVVLSGGQLRASKG